MERIKSGEFSGITSALTLDEIAFSILKVEVGNAIKNYDNKAILKAVKRNPTLLKIPGRKISDTVDNISKIPNLRIVEVNMPTIKIAANYVSEYLLLPRDSIHLATMNAHKILCLASNDADFERVAWVKLYRPEASR